jgi:MFS family permease
LPAPNAVTVAAGVLEGAATKLLPVQALGLGFTPALAAATVTAFGAGNLLTQYACGRLADRFGVVRLSAIALVVACGLALLLPAAAADATVYLAALAALGGIVGALYTLAIIQAGGAGATHEVMAVVAGISVSYTAGSLLGPLLAGAATSASLVWGLPLLMALTTGGVVTLLAAARPGQAGQRF